MNTTDTIKDLAAYNAKSNRPKRLSEIDKSIPYFYISPYNEIIPYNYLNHDNAPRMPFILSYLTSYILPNIKAPISGYYNIELHDSYTYLNNNKSYKNVLTFSKFIQDHQPTLIPDPYMLSNYAHTTPINDNVSWSKKISKAIFYGTTTGNTDPTQNTRINLCRWSLSNPSTDFKITKIAQIPEQDIFDIKSIKTSYKYPAEQLKYKYHLNIDGNTCKFDTWYYNTNTMILKYPSRETLWYYPLIQHNTHTVLLQNKEDITKQMIYFDNNPIHAQFIINNMKQMYSNLFRPINYQIYLTTLFETMSLNK